MKKIMPHVMGIMFAIFGMAVIALLMIYSFSALGRLFPGNFIAQVMGMVLFDVAALVWLGTVIYLCKSVGQYALSAIGFILGLGGTLLLVAAEVMMGGQELTEVPAWAGDSIVWVFILALVGHVVLYYAFKLSAPEISAEISLGYETAAITDEAMKQATEQLIRERGALGQIIAPRMITDVKRSLGLPVAGDVLELTAQNVDEAAPLPIQIPASQYAGVAPKPKAQSDFLKRLQFAKDAFLNPSKFSQAPAPFVAFDPVQDSQPVQPQQDQPAPAQAPAQTPAPAPAPVQTPAPAPQPAQAPVSPNVPSAPQTEQEEHQPWQPPFILPKRKHGDNGGTPASEEPTASPS